MPAWCILCLKEFSSSSNLKRHSMEVHGVDDIQSDYDCKYDDGKYMCLEGCDVSFEAQYELVAHLQTFHDIVIEKEELKFTSESDYLLWLKSIFKHQHTEYVKSQRMFDENTEMICYKCLCAGDPKTADEDIRKRKYKSPSQSKSNKECTSQVLIKKQDDCYAVTFYKTHYGHNTNDYGNVEYKSGSTAGKRRRFDLSDEAQKDDIPMITFDILHEEMENELSNIQKNMYNVIDIHTLSKALHVLQNTNDFLVTNFDHFEYFYDVVEDIEVVIDNIDGKDIGESDEINEYYLNSRDDIEMNPKSYLNSNPSMEKGEVIISNDSQFDHSYYLCH